MINQVATSTENAMKVLFLSQGEEKQDHPGWQDALETLVEEGFIADFLNVPYLGYAKEKGWNEFYRYVVDVVEKGDFDVVYFHYFHKPGVPSPMHCMQQLRSLSCPPVILTSAGDPFSDNWMRPDYPDNFKDASRMADITFSTQMGKAADKMIGWGARNVVFAPNSMCQKRFQENHIDPAAHSFDFDVVFVGNKNGSRVFNPTSRHWWAALKRNRLVKALNARYGERFGLFGKGWTYSSVQGQVRFGEQQDAFRRGRVVIGGNPFSSSDYYSSNRLFFEVSSGIPIVELKVPRLENVLRNKDHVFFEDSVGNLIKRIDKLLDADPVKIYKRAGQAARYVAQRHTQYHRMKFKLDVAKQYRDNGFRLPCINLPFFLPEVDLKTEWPFAIKNNG